MKSIIKKNRHIASNNLLCSSRSWLFVICLFFTFSLSAQKNVRKAVRDGNKAYKDQLYGNAEEQFKKAQAENQASKEASFNLANTYYKQQKWEESLKEYQHYMTLENQDHTKVASAWANVGNTYLKKKANEKGQQPQNPQQQGGEQKQQKPDDLKLSMEAYKNALRLNPNDDRVRYNLAVVQKMIQDNKDQDNKNQKNKDQDKKDQDKKDQDKKDQDKKDQDKKDQKQNDKKQDQQQDKNGMSEQNMQQILNAIEQDERETQQRVKEAQAEERKIKNQRNKKQNKDW